MKYVVSTQGIENYGAHAESGKFSDGKNYWKFKPGTDYLVEGLDRPADAMAFVMAIGVENSVYWKEFPCHVETQEEFEARFDLSDAFDKEHYEFKIKHMKQVNPATYKKEAA